MKIKVYPGPFCNLNALDEDGFIEMEEGAVVGDVLRKIKYPILLSKLGLFTVNYSPAKAGTKLKDGDIISIITPIAGG